MTADIIPFQAAARRIRDRRDSGRIAGSEFFWIATLCCLPVGMSMLAGLAALEVSRAFIAGAAGSRS